MNRSALFLLLTACSATAGPSAPPPPTPPSTSAPATDTPVDFSAGTTPAVAPPSKRAHIEDEQNTIDVFRAAAPATVFVTQIKEVNDYWSRRALEVPAGTGSGFLWDKAGHVVTNYHVV